MIEPGVYPSLSNEDYHADPAVSRSGIMTFLKSPYKYWSEYLNPYRPLKEPTKAMDFGTAFHSFVLEPRSKFFDEYIIKPESVKLKDVGRVAYNAYKTKFDEVLNTNKIILSMDDYHILARMYESIWNNKQAHELIEGATYESSYFWQCEHSGIMCKARPDILHHNIIVDLKTCADASSRAYQRAMVDGGYHIQGAMIREGIKQLTGKDISTVINICVEKTYPYEIAIKIISEDALEFGHKKFKQALLDIKHCIEYNKWESYEPEIVNLPSWVI
jgi:hypothetical protein